jgi:hypothetical protein
MGIFDEKIGPADPLPLADPLSLIDQQAVTGGALGLMAMVPGQSPQASDSPFAPSIFDEKTSRQSFLPQQGEVPDAIYGAIQGSSDPVAEWTKVQSSIAMGEELRIDPGQVYANHEYYTAAWLGKDKAGPTDGQAIVDAWKSSTITTKMTDIIGKAYLSGDWEGVADQLAVLKEQMPAPDTAKRGFPISWLTAASSFMAQQGYQSLAAMNDPTFQTVAGAAGGLVAAATVGGAAIGGVGAIPTGLGSAAIATGLITAGYRGARGKVVGRLEAGGVILQGLEAGIPLENMMVPAGVAAALNMAIEAIPLGHTVSKIFGKQIAAKAAREVEALGISGAVKDTFSSALAAQYKKGLSDRFIDHFVKGKFVDLAQKGIGKGAAKALATGAGGVIETGVQATWESGTEAAQQLVSDLAYNAAADAYNKTIPDDMKVEGMDREAILRDMADTFVEMWKGSFLTMGALHGGTAAFAKVGEVYSPKKAAGTMPGAKATPTAALDKQTGDVNPDLVYRKPDGTLHTEIKTVGQTENPDGGIVTDAIMKVGDPTKGELYAYATLRLEGDKVTVRDINLDRPAPAEAQAAEAPGEDAPPEVSVPEALTPILKDMVKEIMRAFPGQEIDFLSADPVVQAVAQELKTESPRPGQTQWVDTGQSPSEVFTAKKFEDIATKMVVGPDRQKTGKILNALATALGKGNGQTPDQVYNQLFAGIVGQKEGEARGVTLAPGQNALVTFIDSQGNLVQGNKPEMAGYREGGLLTLSREQAGQVKALIVATEGTDLPALIHEFFHAVERLYLTDSQVAAFEEALNAKRGDWTVRDLEYLADHFEVYLKTGKAPTKALQKAFYEIAKIFHAFMREFKNIAARYPERKGLTPELSKAYDGLFTAEAPLAQAQKEDAAVTDSVTTEPATGPEATVERNIEEVTSNALYHISPPYAATGKTAKKYKAWEEALSDEARKTFEFFKGIVEEGEGLTLQVPKKVKKKLVMTTPPATSAFVTVETWNKNVANSKEVKEYAQSTYAKLTPVMRERMRLNADGTITETDFDKEFKVLTSFIQRVVDAMPEEDAPDFLLLPDGKKVDLAGSNGRLPGVNGGEAYRRAILQAKRDDFVAGKLRKVGIGTLSKDNWGAMGFLAENEKTIGSGDFTTICPQMFYNKGCYYCYRRASMESGVNVKLAAERIWYTGEILQLTDADVKALNKVGGLRIQSFGDWMGTRDQAQFADMIIDAEARGLQAKIITKEPKMVEFVAHLKSQGLAQNVFMNISCDHITEEAGAAGESEAWEPLNGDRPFKRDAEGRGMWKRALSVKEGHKLSKKYPWVNVRTVAMTREMFLADLADDRVQVITGYHGHVRSPGIYIADSETGEKIVQFEPLGDSGMPGLKGFELSKDKKGNYLQARKYKQNTELVEDKNGELKKKKIPGSFTLLPAKPVKLQVQRTLAKEIDESGLAKEYATKACCIFGNCGQCKTLCGSPEAAKSYLKGTVRFPLRDQYLSMQADSMGSLGHFAGESARLEADERANLQTAKAMAEARARMSEEERRATPPRTLAHTVFDDATGLPLNEDGTVTVYHGTTKQGAEGIGKTGKLKSAGEPDVYVTTDPSGGAYGPGEKGYGDGTVIALRVDPALLILDDEFPDGRKDFRIDTGKPGGSAPVALAHTREDLLAEARKSSSFEDFKAYIDLLDEWAIPGVSERETPAGLEGEARDKWLRDTYTEATKGEADPKAATDRDFLKTMTKEGGVEEFLNQIWAVLSGATQYEQYGATDAEEQANLEKIMALRDRINSEVHPTVLNNAVRLGRAGAKITDRARKSILSLMRQGLTDYKDLWAEMTQDEALLAQTAAEKEARQSKLETLPDPKAQNLDNLTIADRVRLSRAFDDAETRKAIESGEIGNEDVQNLMESMDEEKKALEITKDELKKKIEEQSRHLDWNETSFLELNAKLRSAESGLKKAKDTLAAKQERLDTLRSRAGLAGKWNYAKGLHDAKKQGEKDVLLAEWKQAEAKHEEETATRAKTEQTIAAMKKEWAEKRDKIETSRWKLMEEVMSIQAQVEDATLRGKQALAKFRAAEALSKYKAQLIKDIKRPPSVDRIHWDEAEQIRALQSYLKGMLDSKMYESSIVIGPQDVTAQTPIIGTTWIVSDFIAFLDANPEIRQVLGKRIITKIEKHDPAAITIKDLENIRDKIDALRDLGRQKLNAIKTAERIKVRGNQGSISDTVEDRKNYVEPKLLSSQEQKKQVQKRDRKYKAAYITWDDHHLYRNVLDNMNRGVNHFLLVQSRRKARRIELANSNRRVLAVNEAFKKARLNKVDLATKKYEVQIGQNKMTFTLGQLMFAKLAFRDEDSRARVVFGNLFTETERAAYRANIKAQRDMGITEIDRSVLLAEGDRRLAALTEAIAKNVGPKEDAVLEVIAKDWAEAYGPMAKVAIEEFNFAPPQVDNYVSMQVVTRGNDKEMTLNEMLRDDLAGRQGMPTLPGKGFLESRIHHIRPENQREMRLDLLPVWQSSVRATEHFVAYTGLVRELNATYRNSHTSGKILEQIRTNFGQGMVERINQSITEMANPPGYTPASPTEQVIRTLRGNYSVAVLGGSVAAISTQVITNPMPFLAYAPFHFFRNVIDMAAGDPLRWIAGVMKKMPPETKEKQAEALSVILQALEASPAEEAMRGVSEDNRAKRGIKKMQELMMGPMSFIVRYINAIGWKSVYDKTLAELGKKGELTGKDLEKAAAEKADELLLENTPSWNPADQAPMFKGEGTGRELMKWATQFAVPLGTQWQQITADIPYYMKKGKVPRAVGIYIAYSMMDALLYLVRGGGGDDEDKWRRALWALLSPLPNSIPFGNLLQITGNVEGLVTGKKKYQPPRDVFPIVTFLGKALGKLAEDPAAAFEAMREAIFIAAGAPTSAYKQYKRAAEGDLGALFGKRKE